MTDIIKHAKLSHAAALKMIDAAMAKATEINRPQCITITDDGGRLLAFVRMDGARFLSTDSSHYKAMTAVSYGAPTGNVSEDVEMKLAHASGGQLVNLFGGLPVIVDDMVIGGIGVGSGTGQQDLEVAKAGLAVLADAKKF
jgi:glc operon protein GlcG